MYRSFYLVTPRQYEYEHQRQQKLILCANVFGNSDASFHHYVSVPHDL